MSGPMVRFGEREIPQAELKRQAALVAAALSASGVEHGDRVAIILRNEPSFLTLSAACGLMGAVPVPVNWHWRGEELRHVVTDSGARAVFAHCARREIERDGYISIGDVGQVDGDGFLHLSDRARDMVISGGVNIYPAEIEACLLELGGVRDVAAFGIPDDSFGEALAAHVDVDPSCGLTETAIRDHVRSRLAGYKVPRLVVFDDNLPREESGKIFKRRIRDRYWQNAGRNI